MLVFTSLNDPRVTDYEREDWGAYGFRSMISLPLIAGDEVVGMIDIFDTAERDYNDVRGFLTSAARTIADALQNAQLMGSLRQSNAALRELVELGDRFSEAEGVQRLARIVAARLRAILEAEDCDIWGIEGGRLKCLASIDSRGWDADEVGSERDLSVYEATIAALAANEPMVIGDLEAASLTEEEMAAYRRWSYRSMVSPAARRRGPPHRADRRLRHQGARLHRACSTSSATSGGCWPAPSRRPARGATGERQPRPATARRLRTRVRRHARRRRGTQHGGGAHPRRLGGRSLRRVRSGWRRRRDPRLAGQRSRRCGRGQTLRAGRLQHVHRGSGHATARGRGWTS